MTANWCRVRIFAYIFSSHFRCCFRPIFRKFACCSFLIAKFIAERKKKQRNDFVEKVFWRAGISQAAINCFCFILFSLLFWISVRIFTYPLKREVFFSIKKKTGSSHWIRKKFNLKKSALDERVVDSKGLDSSLTDKSNLFNTQNVIDDRLNRCDKCKRNENFRFFLYHCVATKLQPPQNLCAFRRVVRTRWPVCSNNNDAQRKKSIEIEITSVFSCHSSRLFIWVFFNFPKCGVCVVLHKM